jgi:hypothetical protein
LFAVTKSTEVQFSPFYATETDENGNLYIFSICLREGESSYYWSLAKANQIFQFIFAVGSFDEGSVTSPKIVSQSYQLGSFEYNVRPYSLSLDISEETGAVDTIYLALDNSDKDASQVLTLYGTDANVWANYPNVDWQQFACMAPVEASPRVIEPAQVWETSPISDQSSPFYGWTDRELFSGNLLSQKDESLEAQSCWAYFDELGEYRIGGSFFDFTIVDNANHRLRLFLWNDIAVDESDACFIGSEIQVQVSEDTMLFTYLCSDEFVGGTSLIYRNSEADISDLECPLFTA